MTREIDTTTLTDIVENGSHAIVDVRSPEAYNGWALRGEARGGHIRSARSLPVKWLNYIDWVEIVDAKGLRPEVPVVVYGYDRAPAEMVASQLERAGFTDVSLYLGFLEEWSSNDRLPMDRLARYEHLVSAEWLHDLLVTGTAPSQQRDRVVVCHAHYRNPADHEEGHIPGAIALDTNLLESERTWNRRSAEELKRTLASLGITHDTTVVLYGRFSFPKNEDPFPGSSAGHLGAMRCAVIMLYAGVRDVRVLNGGLQSWLDAGYPLQKGATKPRPEPDFGAEIPQNPELIVDLPEAKQILEAADANLVSVRSYPEYIGEVSGYNYIEKTGRIPGSVFGNCGSDAYHMENYRNLDHTCREYHEIEKLWADVGVTREKWNAFYCGTGWRGSEATFNAWLMGWPRIALYDGGWFEWSSNPDNPIATGDPAGGH